MKVRSDFVTNSSSSSFIIAGPANGEVITEALKSAKIYGGAYTDLIIDKVAQYFENEFFMDGENDYEELDTEELRERVLMDAESHLPWFRYDRQLKEKPTYYSNEYYHNEMVPKLKALMEKAPKKWSLLDEDHMLDVLHVETCKSFKEMYEACKDFDAKWKDKYPEGQKTIFKETIENIDKYGGWKRLDDETLKFGEINISKYNNFESKILADASDNFELHIQRDCGPYIHILYTD